MKITNKYIALLRHTSIMGKRCSLEIPHQDGVNYSQQKKFKYCGSSGYKTLPITTPTSINLLNNHKLYFDTFKTGNLIAGKSLSSIYDSWFSIL